MTLRFASLLLLTLASTSLIVAPAPAEPAAPAVPSSVVEKLAAIEDTAALERIAAGFHEHQNWDSEAATWRRLVELRPHVGKFKFNLAVAYARQDKKSEAYTALLELQGQGYGFDIADDERFGKVATTEVWQYIVVGFNANREPFGSGKVAYSLPREDLLIESLAFDASRKSLLVGSARKGSVYRVQEGGKLKPLVTADATNGMWSVFDLAVDAKRNRLWVASTAVPHFENYDPTKDLGRAGVFEFALDSGKFIKRYLSPEVPGQSFFLSSICVGGNGEVYAADGVNNAVYMVRDGEFKRLFHAPRLTSIRGMTVNADGSSLYFADHERGILGVDLATGRPFDLRVPKNLALGGVDGLLWWKDSLVAVQNDMQPMRVMRLKISADGHSVEQVTPLEANQPLMSMPTMITSDGSNLLVLANSQKGNYDRFGLLRDKSKLEATRIYQLDPESTPPAPDMQPFLDIGKNSKMTNGK